MASSALKAYKFIDLAQLNHWLQGGVIGGVLHTTEEGSGFYGLVGATLTFATPSDSVTFLAGSSSNGFLTFAEVKEQIETAVSGVLVTLINQRIAVIESIPANGISIGSASAESARGILGFNGAAGGYVTNLPKNPMVGVAPTLPYIVSVTCPCPDSYTVVVWEEV